MRCLYCPAELGAHNETLAHVFADALGGKLCSPEVCCASCNNSFTGVESRCVNALAVVGALLGARKGDGTPIEASFEHEGRRFRARAGSMLEEAPPPTDKGRRWPLPADGRKQVDQVIRALRERKLPPEALNDGRMSLADAADDEEPEGLRDANAGVSTPMEWGFAEAKRMQIKIACELLAHSRADVARNESLREACAYARNGRGDWHVPFDSSTSGSGLPEVAAPYRHAVDVWTNNRCLHSRLTLFTELRFVATLTSAWEGPSLQLSYSFDCRDPAEICVEHGNQDGAMLIRKSARVSHSELLEASARLSETMKMLTPNPIAYRAESLSQGEFYRQVKQKFDLKPWQIR